MCLVNIIAILTINPQAEVCLACKTKNHSLKYICPILEEDKKQEGNNRSYRDDNHPEQVYQVNDGATSIQVTLIVKLLIPMVRQTGQLYWQNVHSDNESACGRNMHRTQQAM